MGKRFQKVGESLSREGPLATWTMRRKQHNEVVGREFQEDRKATQRLRDGNELGMFKGEKTQRSCDWATVKAENPGQRWRQRSARTWRPRRGVWNLLSWQLEDFHQWGDQIWLRLDLERVRAEAGSREGGPVVQVRASAGLGGRCRLTLGRDSQRQDIIWKENLQESLIKEKKGDEGVPVSRPGKPLVTLTGEEGGGANGRIGKQNSKLRPRHVTLRKRTKEDQLHI